MKEINLKMLSRVKPVDPAGFPLLFEIYCMNCKKTSNRPWVYYKKGLAVCPECEEPL